MKRDIELERKILLKIEEVYQPGDNKIFNLAIDGYSKLLIAEHCRILHQKRLIGGYFPVTTINDKVDFEISDMSAAGYDYLEMIRKDSDWKKIIKEVEEKELPKTIENIAKVAGIIIGKVFKEMNDLP